MKISRYVAAHSTALAAVKTVIPGFLAFIFLESAFAQQPYRLKRSISAPGGSDTFGASVAISGMLMVVGAVQDDTGATDAGSVYVYDFSSGTPTIPVLTLNNPTPTAGDYFGFSVAISGTRVVVGAIFDDTGSSNAGSAYVYDLSSGSPAIPVATLPNPTPAENDHFGISVALSGTRVVIGAFVDDGGAENAGSAYVYDLTSSSPTIPVTTLNNPTPAVNDSFGISVAIAGTRVVVGASQDDTGASDAGSVYVYDLSSGTPTIPAATLNNPTPAAGDYFGYSLAISGTRVVVGAVYDHTGASDAGSAYVYDLSSGTPTIPVATLNNPTQVAGDHFGISVAIADTRVVVGAHQDDTGASNTGSAYVYDLSSGTPMLPAATLNNPGPAENDRFGGSVAISGTRVVVGAALDDTGATDAGSAYIFDADINPVANPDTVELPMYHFNVNVNDTDDDLDPLTVTGVGAAVHGTATLHGDNTISYTPNGTFAGTDSFTYTISDGFGGTATGTVTVQDTIAPTIGGPFAPLTVFTRTNLADYVPQAVTSDVTTVSVMQDPVPGTETSVGTTTVTLTATDAGGNQTSTSFDVIVRPLGAVSTALFGTGDLAPGAGDTAGPPADAMLTSLGVPAVDEAGDVAFLGRWNSVSGGKGSGVFTQTKCVAKVGAIFKTLADPVAGGGHVAFRATLAGVPAASAGAVISGPPESPAVIAQTGTVAPGSEALPLAGRPVFKSFKAVAVEGESVAILAQLGGGSGVGRVSAANDSGMWLKDATHPLTLVLREGQMIGDRTIKTLVAFTVGNGSPGQGRGWLTQSASYGPQVLALALFTGTDHAQAVLRVGLTGDVSVLSRNGIIGVGGPDLSGAIFASYGVPAANSADKIAFLGSLMVGGTVTKANARGIFVDYGNPTYTTIARVTQQAGETGATFGTLKDPVFSADDGVAFPATLKGSTVRGLASTTLWWKPADSDLKLLAQGGKRPGNDLPADAQWKTFPSLAIAAARGPIFKAMLVTGKGGVTSTTASGVWAVDFTGAPRLLFRTGDMIDGRKLKSFALLNATVGSTGVTRSFNDAAEVVWLATFTDKSTAIITTVVP